MAQSILLKNRWKEYLKVFIFIYILGPIELYQGMKIGTSSLVTNTVAGTFDTVKTLTGAVSSGLTQITLDDDYMRDRQRKS